jgi:hypothetical protein
MKQVCFSIPSIDQVSFTIECLDEDIQPSESMEFQDQIDYVINQYNNGNEWAWCCVKVTAEYKGIKGSDYLGGCSYNSKEDFMSDGYYADMKIQAYDELVKELESLND